jgi:PKD repeat protein
MKSIGNLAGTIFLGLLASFTVHAQTVTRGPYLQLQTDDGITIQWRTDIATDSVVRFGATAGNLDQSVTVAGLTTEHSVSLTGLGAAQTFFYSVGDSIAALAGDASYHFSTAPIRGAAADTRIWVLGDSGTANANAVAVRDAYKTWAAADPADFWLMLGDNAYNDGTDAEYQAAVFDIYPEILRQLTLWSTLGNHDGHRADSGTQTGPYYDIFKLPASGEAGGLASGTEAYYSFDYANIHFVCLDSYDSDRAVNGTMLQWLESDLMLNTQPWVIAFWHHPPYTKGSHDSDTEGRLIDMRQNALPILESWGVDLVMSGHSHSYERSYLLDGHYGISETLNPVNHVLDPGDGSDSGDGGDGAYEKPGIVGAENAGAVYAVAGSSGKVSVRALDHPAMFVGLNELGSLVIDVSGNRMDVVFLDGNGLVQDEFTVLKTPDSDPPLISDASAEDSTHVNADFNEPVNSYEATQAANYTIAGLTVGQAELLNGDRSVRLTTDTMTDGTTYTLEVSNVQDIAGNTILPGSSVDFDFFEVMTMAFQDGLAPDTAYDGTRDAYIREASASMAHGLETSLQVDGDEPSGTSTDMNILLHWDISAIPSDATVRSAQIQLETTNPSGGSYGCFSLLSAWEESQVTWNQAASATPWGTPGAEAAGDRDNQPRCTVSAGSTGPITVDLTGAGLEMVQAWVNDPSGNHGLIISDPSTTDGADFHSRESAAALARPRLEVTYSVAVTPPVNIDPVAGFTFTCTDLDCDFTEISTDSDGSVVSWAWDFDDGFTSTSQNPSHSYASAGNYMVSLTVTDDDAATDTAYQPVLVTEPPSVIDQLAEADLPVAGTVSGNYTDTHANGGNTQSIRERESGGKKNQRHSYLTHTWRFSVAPGASVALHANAWSGGSSDGDNFVFAWSSDNSSGSFSDQRYDLYPCQRYRPVTGKQGPGYPVCRSALYPDRQRDSGRPA